MNIPPRTVKFFTQIQGVIIFLFYLTLQTEKGI